MSEYPVNPFNHKNNVSPTQEQQFYTAQWQPVNPGYIPPETPKKKTRRIKKGTAALIACCMLFSGVLGVGGGYLGTKLAGSGKTVLFENKTPTATNTSTGDGASIAEIAEKASNSVVEIATESVTNGNRLGQFVSKGAGSGVILSADGYIATNYHVINGASKITVRTKDGTSYTASVIGSDEQSDLAVLKIESGNLTPVVFGSSANLVVGETAIAIGNPLGELGGTVTNGIISALDRQITIDGQTMTLLQTNAAINPGNSGGGLFNSSGELIGIVNAKSSGSGVEGLGFAIPSDTAKEIITQLINNGKVSGRVDAGFEVVDLTDAQTAMQYGVQKLGIYVNKVTSLNSPLQSGDLILSINGTEIDSLNDYNSVLSGSKVGDTLSFTILRGGQQVTENVTLGEQGA